LLRPRRPHHNKTFSRIATRNDEGQMASVLDANGKTTSYGYDAFGDVVSTSDPSGYTTTASYDIRGRKVGMSDPDMGAWSYVYDPLNELSSQTDAKSQTTSLTYDLLGRPMRRIATDFTSLWTYDTGPNGIGALAHSCAASTCTSANHERTPFYNTLGQVDAVSLKIDGTSYTYSVTYNTDGRVATVTYPSGFEAACGQLSRYGESGAGAALRRAASAKPIAGRTRAPAK
jgi:YD repeat-containing protein